MPGSDQLKPPTALRAIAREAVAQSTSELVGWLPGVNGRGAANLGQARPPGKRHALERTRRPYYKACGF